MLISGKCYFHSGASRPLMIKMLIFALHWAHYTACTKLIKVSSFLKDLISKAIKYSLITKYFCALPPIRIVPDCSDYRAITAGLPELWSPRADIKHCQFLMKELIKGCVRVAETLRCFTPSVLHPDLMLPIFCSVTRGRVATVKSLGNLLENEDHFWARCLSSLEKYWKVIQGESKGIDTRLSWSEMRCLDLG